MRIDTPRIAYVGNRGARVLRHADAIREDLATNLRYPVRWHDSTIALSELGAKIFVEMPPGQTLTAASRRRPARRARRSRWTLAPIGIDRRARAGRMTPRERLIRFAVRD